MKKNYILFIICCLIIAATLTTQAQPGSLDLTFSSDGKVTTDFVGYNDRCYSVAIQSDGKIIVAGTSQNNIGFDFGLIRYNSDGSLDSTFSSDGKVTTPIGSNIDGGRSIAIQSDGKILVTGYSEIGTNTDFALVRYNSDGSLDNTFSFDGKVTTPVGISDDYGYSVSIQSDGKIIVAGYSEIGTNTDFALVRYNTDGSLDSTFDSDGKVTTPVSNSYDNCFSVAIQSDGKILAAGGIASNPTTGDFALVRYNSNGSLDTTFSSDGKVTTPVGSLSESGYSVTIQDDGKILVAGKSDNGTGKNFALVRYNSNGSLDSTFDSDGKVTAPFLCSIEVADMQVAIQSDGRILMAGSKKSGTAYQFALVRYLSDGSLDSAFDSDGIVTTIFGNYTDHGTSSAIQSDGKILMAGSSYNGADDNFALVRYNVACSPINFSQSPIICNGQSITVGSNTYTASGTYIDTLTANGCDSIVATNLIVNPLPTATITPSGATTFCQGNSVTLTASAATSYLWSNIATTQSITVSTSGNYSVTVTDGNSCSATSTPTTVTVSPLPIATITPSGATTFCQGDSVTLTASAASSYLWSNSATTQSITVSTSGNYSITVTNGNGCSATSTPPATAVTVNPLPIKPTITINGTTLTSSSATGNQWYLNGNIISGATSQTYTVTQNGIYTVVVTNSNGCSATSLPYNYTIIGIEELLIDNGIIIIPNPSNGRFRIKTNNFKLDRIKILNTLGSAIYQSEIRNTEIDLSAQPKGIYFIEVQTKDKTYKGKLIIQ